MTQVVLGELTAASVASTSNTSQGYSCACACVRARVRVRACACVHVRVCVCACEIRTFKIYPPSYCQIHTTVLLAPVSTPDPTPPERVRPPQRKVVALTTLPHFPQPWPRLLSASACSVQSPRFCLRNNRRCVAAPAVCPALRPWLAWPLRAGTRAHSARPCTAGVCATAAPAQADPHVCYSKRKNSA